MYTWNRTRQTAWRIREQTPAGDDWKYAKKRVVVCSVPLNATRSFTISSAERYDTRCYFNVRSKANMSQLNLPNGTNN